MPALQPSGSTVAIRPPRAADLRAAERSLHLCKRVVAAKLQRRVFVGRRMAWLLHGNGWGGGSSSVRIEAATQHSNLHAQHEVLVVDDFDPAREAVVAVLEMKGLSASAVASGTEALTVLRRGLRPCVMLLDVRMPGLGGWEVWDRMRQDAELATIPVVLLSADPADPTRARSVGIREFVEKPIDAARLVAIVDRHCEHRPVVVRNETPARDGAAE